MATTTTATKKIGVLTFFGMTVALVASVRNIPNVAASGWTMLFYMLVATLLFALPIALISGEFAGMMPKAGGPELWVTNSLSERWGFTTSWLLWVQMFPGMVMVAAVIAPLFAVTTGNQGLATSSEFTLLCILVVYWAISVLNMFFDMARLGGRIGVVLGIYIPAAVMLVLGVAAVVKVGLKSDSYLGGFKLGDLLPFSTDSAKTLTLFASIMFIYTGIEMSSVYLPRLRHPLRTYLRGIFLALIFMFVMNTFLALLTADVVPRGTIELNNIAQAPAIFVSILGLPSWITNVFAASVLIGVIVQLSAWASGPSKTITASARRGLYPPVLRYWKTNKHDVAPTVVLTQACVVSVFALLFLLVPGVNSAFLLLVTATAIIYIVVYVLMAIGIARMRTTQPDLARPFRIGRHHGNDRLLYVLVAVLLVAIVASTGATLWYQGPLDAFLLIAITAVLTVAPLIIVRMRKPSWLTDVNAALGVTSTNPDHPSSETATPSEGSPAAERPGPVDGTREPVTTHGR
jgi:amino acid transporter